LITASNKTTNQLKVVKNQTLKKSGLASLDIEALIQFRPKGWNLLHLFYSNTNAGFLNQLGLGSYE
jgi:hypothetical protein